MSLRLGSAFDFRGGERDPVTRLQHLIGGTGLTVHPDQVVLWCGGFQALFKELLDGGAVRHVNVIRKPAAVVVDKQNSHESLFWLKEQHGTHVAEECGKPAFPDNARAVAMSVGGEKMSGNVASG